MLSIVDRDFEKLKNFINVWHTYRISEKSAALAYYAIFSFGPLAIIILSISSIFFSPDTIRQYLLNIFSAFLGPNGAATISGLLQNVSPVPLNSLITILVLLYGSLGMLRHIKRSIAHILGKPQVMEKTSMLILTGLIILSGYVTTFNISTIWFSIVKFVLQSTILTIFFVIIYHLFSSKKLSTLLPGAVIAGIAFNLLRILFGIYLSYSRINDIFGASSSIILLLLYIYISAQIFFFGALVPHIIKIARK